jgi:hypothetical protein
VPWVDVFAVFVVSHLAGDYLIQTDWQAIHKRGGLGRDPVARRALLSHVTTYTLVFVPALIWLAGELGAAVVAVAALVFVPHLVQDDGRLLRLFIEHVKGPEAARNRSVVGAVDQSFHMLVLFGLALLTVELG